MTAYELSIPQRANVLGVGIHSVNLQSAVELMELVVDNAQKNSAVSKDEMFSSKLKGLNVYNQKDESIGEITDIAIKNHQIDALILSVGGFLGMGEHYVAVSPASVSVRHDAKNDKWLASMNTTKEALKAAPEFKYPK